MLLEGVDPYYNAIRQALTNLFHSNSNSEYIHVYVFLFPFSVCRIVICKPWKRNPVYLCQQDREPPTSRFGGDSLKLNRLCPLNHSNQSITVVLLHLILLNIMSFDILKSTMSFYQ